MPDEVSGSVAVIVLSTPEIMTESNGLLNQIQAIQEKYAKRLVGGSVLLLGANSKLPVCWRSTSQLPEGISAFRKDEIEGAFQASFGAIEEIRRRYTGGTAPFETVLVWHSEANLDVLRDQRVTVPDGSPVYLAWAGLESERGSVRLKSAFDSEHLLYLRQSPSPGALVNYVGHRLLQSTENTAK